MSRYELHLTEAAGWRALLTEAQLVARTYLSEDVEEHLVWILYKYLGIPGEGDDSLALTMLQSLLQHEPTCVEDLPVIGDQCLLFAGLFPEHAIRKGIPITYFVQLGRHAYHKSSIDGDGASYVDLCDDFVAIMDVLHTLRELRNGQPCIDAMNAYHLWNDAGSTHAFEVLRRFTPALPVMQANDAYH